MANAWAVELLIVGNDAFVPTRKKMGIWEDCRNDAFIIGSTQKDKPTGIPLISSQSSTSTTKSTNTNKSHVCIPSRHSSYSQAANGALSQAILLELNSAQLNHT